MNNNNYKLLQLNPDQGIVFAAVDSGADMKYYEDGITYYPTEEALRTDRLGNKNIIWLEELADKKCKKCNGTGTLGTMVMDFAAEIFEDILRRNLEKTPEKIPTEIIGLTNSPETYRDVIMLLVDIARDDLQPDNLNAVCVMYAKELRKDFKQKKVQWCKCYLDNFRKQVNDTIRNIKYGVN